MRPCSPNVTDPRGGPAGAPLRRPADRYGRKGQGEGPDERRSRSARAEGAGRGAGRTAPAGGAARAGLAWSG
ncbi:hypothetical protein CP979_03320 [Streptomyces filamentosus]|nr:hypothetical protein CP979_03320 [Streptomyces filamentosus]